MKINPPQPGGRTQKNPPYTPLKGNYCTVSSTQLFLGFIQNPILGFLPGFMFT